MSGLVVFRNFVVGILMIVMFPCTLFFFFFAGSRNPFVGKKYHSTKTKGQ